MNGIQIDQPKEVIAINKNTSRGFIPEIYDISIVKLKDVLFVQLGSSPNPKPKPWFWTKATTKLTS